MLKKRYRLKSRRAFKRAMGGRSFCASPSFALYAIERKQPSVEPMTRFGLVISRKVDKRATRRNRIKRRLREILRLMLRNPEQAQVFCRYEVLVFIVRSGALMASYQELTQQVQRCMLRSAPSSPARKSF